MNLWDLPGFKSLKPKEPFKFWGNVKQKKMITIEQLQKIATSAKKETLEMYLPHINTLCPKYGIDTKNELASFLSQVLHESGEFKWMREIWGPTATQLRYEGRKDLGNVIKGDGKKFMGRGPIQITGRSNYRWISQEIFGDDRLLDKPDLLTTPEYGIQSACIYWEGRGLDAHDDDLVILRDTKLVSGGTNGLADRQKYFDRAISVL